VTSDPQAIANDYFTFVDHPTFGRTKMTGFPWDFSETPPSIRRVAPELGEHTEEILQELGYTQQDIAELRQEGAIP